MSSIAILTLLFSSFVHQAPSTPGGEADLIIYRSGGRTAMSFPGGESFRLTRAGVINPKLVRVPGSTALVATWSEQNGRDVTPFYAISLDGRTIARVGDSGYQILLRYAQFDPLVAVPPVPAELSAGIGSDIYIVQFVTQPLEGYRSAIRDAGGTIYAYLANHAYIVKMSPSAGARVARQPFVRWIGPYQPAYRLEELLLDELINAKNRMPARHYNIQVFEKGPSQKAAVATKIRSIGGTINAQIPDGYILEATLTPDQLLQIARMNEVLFIDRWGPPEEDMNNARLIGGAVYIEGVEGYRGQGVRGEVMDGNVRSTHVDFSSPPLIFHGARGGSTSHGTPTTGIVFGQGRGSSIGTGMLPAAQGIFADYGFARNNRYVHTQQLVQSPYYAVFQSNSWGDPRTTQYNTFSFLIDDIIFDFDIIITQSQSNAGNQMSRPQAWGKNSVAVGGVRHNNTLTKTDDRWGGGASTGPAADGRVKPDFTHFYDSIFCTYWTSDTAYTSSFGGTSGATPIVAGHFGLFFQMWADGIFGQTVTGDTVFDARPHFSTAKAMMVNSAAQYNWLAGGANADLTRFRQGWGMPDVRNLFDRRAKTFIINESDVLTNLSSTTYRVFVPAGEPALRATMVYADPPGTTSSSQHRINDLTLKVTSPGGTVYWGNGGLIANIWSSSGGSPNTIDTVENVFVQNPQSGVWLVEVRADELNQDSHVETPQVDADYALIVSGVISGLAPTSYQVTFGTPLSGGVTELERSDNSRARVGSLPAISVLSPSIQVVVETTSPTTSLTELLFRLEAAADFGIATQRIELFNYNSNAWEQVDASISTGGDSVVEFLETTNASRFVHSGTRLMRARIGWHDPGIPTAIWEARIDQTRWEISP